MSTDLSVTLPASAKAAPRPSLTVMLVLHSVFTALRAIFSRDAGEAIAARLDELIALGHLTVARAFLAPYAAEPSAPYPDRVVTAVEAASRALVAAIDTAMMSAPVDLVRRRFYARVSLMGRQDLGVCHVSEERLGGADMLLLEQLEHEGRPCHWVKASSCYQISEVTERAAFEAALAGDVRRAQQRERDEQRERAAARTVELAKIERAKGPVIFRTCADSSRVVVCTRVPDALQADHADVRAILFGLDLNEWEVRTYREGAETGFTVFCRDAEHRDELFEALRGLGFASVEQEVAPRAATIDDVDADDDCEVA